MSMADDVVHYMLKVAESEELATKVYDYLKSDYPKETLTWVKEVPWRNTIVPLDGIKMGRRPGGARETDKTNAIKEKYLQGEKLDPVVIVKDSAGDYRLADGYHRTLGRKQAGFKNIDAYVAEVDTTDGPWRKEMHEQKLSKGVKYVEKKASFGGKIDTEKLLYGSLRGANNDMFEKQASLQYAEHDMFEKQANPALAAFGTKALSGAKKFGTSLGNFGQKVMGTQARNMKKQYKVAKKNAKGYGGDNVVGRTVNKVTGTDQTTANLIKQQEQNAKAAYKGARKEKWVARGKLGAGAVGTKYVYDAFNPTPPPPPPTPQPPNNFN